MGTLNTGERPSEVRHLGEADKVRLVADTDEGHFTSHSMEPTADGLHFGIGTRKN